jgi:hypothetical protein
VLTHEGLVLAGKTGYHGSALKGVYFRIS